MTDDEYLAPPPQVGDAFKPPKLDDPLPYQPEPYIAPAGRLAPSYSQPAYEQPAHARAPYEQQVSAPPGYGSSAYPPPPMAYPGQSRPKTWMNWVAFGCGLGGLATCGFTSLFAIVFGHLGISAAKRGEADYRGAGITGLVLGYLIAGAYVAYYAFAIIAGMAGSIS